jgi:hypothetical protein
VVIAEADQTDFPSNQACISPTEKVFKLTNIDNLQVPFSCFAHKPIIANSRVFDTQVPEKNEFTVVQHNHWNDPSSSSGLDAISNDSICSMQIERLSTCCTTLVQSST